MTAHTLHVVPLLAFVLLAWTPRADAGREDPPPPVERTHFSFEPALPRGWRQTRNQVTVELGVIDATNYQAHPEVWREVPYVHKDSGAVEKLPWAACQFPMFQAVVQNSSPQALRFGRSEVITMLSDSAGATLYAATRDDLLDGKEPLWRMAAQMNGWDPEAMTRDLARADEQMARSLPLVTGEATALPGDTSTFYACFFYEPWSGDPTAIERWMRSHDELVLGLYDVPVARDEAGAILNKTSYEFKVKVAEWRWIYRYAWDQKARTWWVQEPEIERVR